MNDDGLDHSKQQFAHGVSSRLPALPLRSLVLPLSPASPHLLGRDPPVMLLHNIHVDVETSMDKDNFEI